MVEPSSPPDGAPLLIGVMGPTASGKTDLAEALADRLDAQLVNADAFQVYRGLDIGTAKPRDRHRYALLDLKLPNESFGLGEFVLAARAILLEAFCEGRHVVVVGGTGLYIRALFERYADLAPAPSPELRERLSTLRLSELVEQLRATDPAAAVRVDLQNPVRVQRALERALAPAAPIESELPPFQRFKVGLLPDHAELCERIDLRAKSMVRNGWREEVETLRSSGYQMSDPGLRAIGYRSLWRHLDGEVEFEAALSTAIAETRQYAKRQRTWLRSEPNLTLLDWRNPIEDVRLKLNL